MKNQNWPKIILGISMLCFIGLGLRSGLELIDHYSSKGHIGHGIFAATTAFITMRLLKDILKEENSNKV